MGIELEVDVERRELRWLCSGPVTLENSRDLFQRMSDQKADIHQCRHLMIVYARGVDLSAFDAEAIKTVQAELTGRTADLFGPGGLERTAFVCPDRINRLALEHFLHHAEGRLNGEIAIFDTRQEAELWFAQADATEA